MTSLMGYISFFGDGMVPIILTIVVAFLIWKRDKLFGWFLLSFSVIGYLAKSWAQNAFQVDRPAAYGCDVLTKYADGYSFPSGHVTFYVIFFGLIAYYAYLNKKEKWAVPLSAFVLLLIGLVGYSRFYLGAHWISDIIGGYILGGIVLVVTIFIYRKINKKYSKKRKK